MNIGRLDRRIVIQAKRVTENNYGEPIESWVEIMEVWASVRPVRGSEIYAAKQTIAGIDTVFKIRFRTVTPENQIVYDGRTYDIQSVVELGRREGLEIYASARAE